MAQDEKTVLYAPVYPIQQWGSNPGLTEWQLSAIHPSLLDFLCSALEKTIPRSGKIIKLFNIQIIVEYSMYQTSGTS